MPHKAVKQSKKKRIFFETILIGKTGAEHSKLECFGIHFRASV